MSGTSSETREVSLFSLVSRQILFCFDCESLNFSQQGPCTRPFQQSACRSNINAVYKLLELIPRPYTACPGASLAEGFACAILGTSSAIS